MTSNPVAGSNYLKRAFIDPRTRRDDGRHNFIQSLPDKNPLLPKGYIDKAFGAMSNNALLRMLRYGDWDVEESEFQIVPISDLREVCWTDIIGGRIMAAGIDIGLGRPDRTVIYTADESGHIRRFDAFSEYDTVRQVTLLRGICAEVAGNGGEVWIDAGGVGKGVADRLMHEFGELVIIPVTFGESPIDELRTTSSMPYADRRAQMYFWAREDIMDAASTSRAGSMPSITLEFNDELIEEMENTFHIPVDGKLRIEPKDNIKRRIGRSPDDADAFILCNAARRTVATRPVALSGRNRERRGRTSRITSGYS